MYWIIADELLRSSCRNSGSSMYFYTRTHPGAAGQCITDAQLDRHVLQWANARVAAAGKARRITSFADPALATGLFLLDLLSAVEPGCGPKNPDPEPKS